MEITKEETTSLGHHVGKRRRSIPKGFRMKKKTNAAKSEAAGSDKEAHSSTNFLAPISFFIMLLLGILGLGVPRGAIMYSFIMVVAMLCTALMGMQLGPKDATYLPAFKYFCAFCAFVAGELLLSISVNRLWQVVITLCLVLLELTRHMYKQVSERLCHISRWVQHKTKAFNKFTLYGGSTKKQAQDEVGQIADMV